MTPDFALSLSVDGIVLLHRAAGGWRRVGAVALTSVDLAGDLAALRARAARLSGGDVRCKLIIPNDQIKYLTLETGAVSTPARLDAARAALDGATPYAVDELVFDVCEDGAQTHVAAAAQETLEEAEAFARLHSFEPLSFVSIPEGAAFLGEPFFGVTQRSEALLEPGDMVEPDGIAVVVIGDVDMPLSDAEGAAAEGPEADAADEPIEVVGAPEAEAKAVPAAEPEPVREPEPEAEPVPEPEPGFASARKPLGGAEREAPIVRAPRLSAPAPAVPKPARVPNLQADAAASLVAAQPQPEPPAPAGGFMSRRTGGTRGFLSRRTAPAAEAPAAAATVADAPRSAHKDEARRMTVFGARQPAGADVVGGKPRFLGLILTAVLLVFLAGIAAWASVFLDSSVARLTPRSVEPVAALPTEALPRPAEMPASEPEPEPEGIEVAALDSGLTAEDAAVLEALQDPRPEPDPEPEPEAALPEPSIAEAEARYAVTGIWPLAPVALDTPPRVDLGDLYIASIDRVSPAQDAVLLPARAGLDTDSPLTARASPAPAGTQFARDAQGRVIPTPDGVLTPDGHMLFAGRPPVEPPVYPDRSENAPGVVDDTARLAAFRPQARPADLIEQTERANLGGLTRSELAAIRPQLRPDTGKEEEEAAAEETGAPVSALATATSYRPSARPRNFARIVERATPAAPEPTRTAAVAPRTVTPRIPSSASVAREATIRNAINLNRVNLIGVYGTPSARRALVRLSNGRYRKVQVGDRIDGGQVSAIGESELRYRKGGRNLVLKMPRG
ncbi:MAG: hypothetical protein AAFY38_10145 [Pseudomonadota bacterium]